MKITLSIIIFLLSITVVRANYVEDRINDFRVENGLSRATTSPKTCSLASRRAKEISTNFSHNGFLTGASQVYGRYRYITENLAMGYSQERVVEIWKGSSGHRANMLANTPFICVGIYQGSFAMEGLRP